MKTREEFLKKKYGFDKGSYDYVPAGGIILKYVGQYVVYVEYRKNDSGNWDTSFKRAFIESISDYDPLNMTYLTKFKVEDEEETREFRMIPEGYCWVETEDANYVQRFLPNSMHCRLVEDEIFYERLKDMWNEKETMSIESLKTLSESKDKGATLNYNHNIGCLMKLNSDPDNVLYFRISKLGLRHKAGNKYNLIVQDSEGNKIQVMITSDQKEYEFEGIGTFKIVDLC